MPISFQTYRTIKRTWRMPCTRAATVTTERHLNTLALLICGIVSARHVQFALIADHVPIRGRKNESIITRFRRWVKHDAITPEALWLPFARAVVGGLGPHAADDRARWHDSWARLCRVDGQCAVSRTGYPTALDGRERQKGTFAPRTALCSD
jgi:hypothetical protein